MLGNKKNGQVFRFTQLNNNLIKMVDAVKMLLLDKLFTNSPGYPYDLLYVKQ